MLLVQEDFIYFTLVLLVETHKPMEAYKQFIWKAQNKAHDGSEYWSKMVQGMGYLDLKMMQSLEQILR